MVNRTYQFVRTGAVVAAVLVLLLCAGSARFAWQYMDATSWVDHTTAVINEIGNTRMLLPGTTVLSGAALRAKVATILEQFERVNDLVRDNPRQQKSAREFRAVFAAAETDPDIRIDSISTAAANAILDRMQQEEYRLLAERIEVQSDAIQKGAIAACALCAALLLMGVLTGLAARVEFRRRAAAEEALVRDKEELTRYTRELSLISAGSEMIQAASDEKQIERAVELVLRDLIPGSSGYCGLVSPSNDLVEICGHWGNGEQRATFQPTDCLALQLGHLIHRSQSPVLVRCPHVPDSQVDYVCTPVRSASGHLGVLHVESREPLSKKRADVLAVFAAHVALGLTNLRMREALQRQTVRDPLTALFNRRYFDETLQRELAASVRHQTVLSVVMLDVDHFKHLNDTWGHAAGDDALRTLAHLIRTAFRESDVLCRFGGEEFAIVLPQATLHDAWIRIDSFRGMVEQTELSSGGRSLGRMTISAGVASSADFSSAVDLVRAADVALYQAKRTGRNVCWVCSDHPGGLPAIPAGAIRPWEASEEFLAAEVSGL